MGPAIVSDQETDNNQDERQQQNQTRPPDTTTPCSKIGIVDMSRTH